MSDIVKEAVGVVLAARKVEELLLDFARRLEPHQRLQVTNSLSGRSDKPEVKQRLLDIWANTCEMQQESNTDDP